MHDIKSSTLTECELAQIHGGASYMDAQGRVHGGSSGFPDSITLPDGTVLQMLPLNASPPKSDAGDTFKASSFFTGAVGSFSRRA